MTTIQRSNNTSSMCQNIRAYKNGTLSCPTNNHLNNSDIAGATTTIEKYLNSLSDDISALYISNERIKLLPD